MCDPADEGRCKQPNVTIRYDTTIRGISYRLTGVRKGAPALNAVAEPTSIAANAMAEA